MPFNVSLSLLYFFRDERSQSLVHVDDSFKTVNDLENHIRRIFKISEPLTLITKKHFLPGSESINLLSNNDEVIVLPRKDNHNVQPEASSSVPRKRRRAGDCKPEDLFQGTDRETGPQISAHPTEINECLEEHSPSKGNKKKKPKIAKPQISETVRNDRPKRNKKSKTAIEDEKNDNNQSDEIDTKSNIHKSVPIHSIDESDEMVVDNSKKKKKKKPKMDSIETDRNPFIKMEFDETNNTSVNTTVEQTVQLDMSRTNTDNKSLQKSNENIETVYESSEENTYVQKCHEKPGKEKLRHSVTFNNKPYYNCRKNNIFTVGNFISNIGNVIKKYEQLEQSNSTQNNVPGSSLKESSLIRNPYCKSATLNSKKSTIKSEIEPAKELKNETISKNTNENKVLSKLQQLEDVANNVMSVENSENEITESENVKNSSHKDNTETHSATELQKILTNGERSSDNNSENRIKLDSDAANDESTHENGTDTKSVAELSDKQNDNSFMKHRRRRRKKKIIRNDDLILNGLCINQSEFVPPRTLSAPLIHIRFSDDDCSESDSTGMSDLTQSVSEIANGEKTESYHDKTDNDSCTVNEQNINDAVQPEELLETNKLITVDNADNIVITDYRKVDLTQHDLNGIKYTVMAREHLPEIGNIIAFKLYKFNEKYEPSVSHWTIGKVINFNQHAFTINLHILAGEVQIQIPSGKFSVEYGQEEQETTIHSDGIVELLWNDLLEPRLLHT